MISYEQSYCLVACIEQLTTLVSSVKWKKGGCQKNILSTVRYQKNVGIGTKT